MGAPPSGGHGDVQRDVVGPHGVEGGLEAGARQLGLVRLGSVFCMSSRVRNFCDKEQYLRSLALYAKRYNNVTIKADSPVAGLAPLALAGVVDESHPELV